MKKQNKFITGGRWFMFIGVLCFLFYLLLFVSIRSCSAGNHFKQSYVEHAPDTTFSISQLREYHSWCNEMIIDTLYTPLITDWGDGVQLIKVEVNGKTVEVFFTLYISKKKREEPTPEGFLKWWLKLDLIK